MIEHFIVDAVSLWHKRAGVATTWSRPIRAQYHHGSRPMRVLHSIPEPEKDDESIEGEASHGHEDVERQHCRPLRWAGRGELEPETRDNLERKYFKTENISVRRVETLITKHDSIANIELKLSCRLYWCLDYVERLKVHCLRNMKMNYKYWDNQSVHSTELETWLTV